MILQQSWLSRRANLMAGVLFIALALSAPSLTQAAETPAKPDNRPERGISIYPDYSGVVVPIGEKVRMDLTVDNQGSGTSPWR